jgi:hypothetical protein
MDRTNPLMNVDDLFMAEADFEVAKRGHHYFLKWPDLPPCTPYAS